MPMLALMVAAIAVAAIVTILAVRATRRASDTEKETQLLTRLEGIATLVLFNTHEAQARLDAITDDELLGLDRTMGIEAMIADLRARRHIAQVTNVATHLATNSR